MILWSYNIALLTLLQYIVLSALYLDVFCITRFLPVHSPTVFLSLCCLQSTTWFLRSVSDSCAVNVWTLLSLSSSSLCSMALRYVTRVKWVVFHCVVWVRFYRKRELSSVGMNRESWSNLFVLWVSESGSGIKSRIISILKLALSFSVYLHNFTWSLSVNRIHAAVMMLRVYSVWW